MDDDKRTKLGAAAAHTPAPVPAPAPDVGGVSKTSYLPPQVDPLLGQLMAGRYHVTKKLGEGGMGAVYLATHQLLEKQVALKVLHGEFARKPDLVERFMQEAKAASRIRHENVIDISDFGSTPEGLVFFAMELLKGHDLHEEIARARLAGELLPWVRSKRIFLQICAALQAAHALGIVHRDLKPENIYLVEFLGEPDFVKLLDFGIAKLTEVSDDGDPNAPPARKLTKTGMLFGTPEYMSPEQARGDKVDHRVDVYAMGCILFQLVTGRVPFEADNFMGVLSLHLTEPPPSIPHEVFDRIGAPRELAQVIDRSLLKDRNQRFGSIEEMANAVRTVCGDPLPTGLTGVHQAQRVQAPAETTTHRAVQPSPTPPPMIPTPVPATGARQRTQWTGNLSVPMQPEAAPAPARSGASKLPWIIIGILLVGGGGAAAFALTRGSGDEEKQVATPPPATPDAAVAVNPPPVIDAAVAGTPPPVTPDAAAVVPETPLPDKVVMRFVTKPPGAKVYDAQGGVVCAKTPCNFGPAPSTAPQRYRISLAKYEDDSFEQAANQAEILVERTLTKLPAGAKPKNPDGGSGDPTIKPPDRDPDKPDPDKPDKPDKPCMIDPITGGCMQGGM